MKPTPCIADRIQLDAALVPANVVQLRREEGLYLGPEKLASVLESPGRLARDVHGLLKVVSALNSIRGLIGLERPLFELILDVIPADRGAIVLVEDTGGLLPGVLAWDKSEGSAPFRICKQMSDRVLAESSAIFSNEVKEGEGAAPRSAMAAPLIAFDRALGFIYLETCGGTFASMWGICTCWRLSRPSLQRSWRTRATCKRSIEKTSDCGTRPIFRMRWWAKARG